MSKKHFFSKDDSGETILTALLGNRIFCSPESIWYKSHETPKYDKYVMAVVDEHLKINPNLLNEINARKRTPIIMAIRSQNCELVQYLHGMGCSVDNLLGKVGDKKIVMHANSQLSQLSRLQFIKNKNEDVYAENVLEKARFLLQYNKLLSKVPKFIQNLNINRPKV